MSGLVVRLVSALLGLDDPVRQGFEVSESLICKARGTLALRVLEPHQHQVEIVLPRCAGQSSAVEFRCKPWSQGPLGFQARRALRCPELGSRRGGAISIVAPNTPEARMRAATSMLSLRLCR